jgi:hypothetical protein
MMKKIVTGLTLFLVAVIVVFVYFRFYFVYGQGVSAGELNYVVKSGWLFKTYEGKLIQVGFGSKLAGALQSHEFQFSVVNDSVAVKLMLNSSKTVELHYKQYFGGLPWRGDSRYIVDSIVSIQEGKGASGIQ